MAFSFLQKNHTGQQDGSVGRGFWGESGSSYSLPSPAEMPSAGKCRCADGVQRTDVSPPIELTDLSITLPTSFFILYVSR